MIAGWAAYCLIVSALLAASAAAVDDVLTRRSRPARWVWLVAIIGSLAAPALSYLAQQRTPSPIEGAGDARVGGIFERVRQHERQAAHARDVQLPHVGRLHMSPWLAADRFVTAAIIACILLATVRVGADSILLFYRRRRWTSNVLDGEQVLVSPSTGPAIVGLLEPAIVVPAWAAALPSDERALMLAHEREHVRARDGLLASGALLGVLCMPWSPALWWAFRRLRTAIEVDCDRRVLRAFPDVARYGRLLVDVAERAGDGSALAITGFSERSAPLARRIRAMTERNDAHLRLRQSRDLAVGVTGAGAVLSAFLLLPPTPAARVLPGYPRAAVMLPKNVGDSISVNMDDTTAMTMGRHLIVGVARDLPDAFIPEERRGRSDEELPPSGRCSIWLRDPRTGARLQVTSSSRTTVAVVQRADTAWTRLAATGFYRVPTPGMYGVREHQSLRVGCGVATHMVVAGQLARSEALSDLSSRSDDRARRIARAVDAAIHLTPNAVELYHGRLNVFVTDSAWMKRPNGRAVMRTAWAAARDEIGLAAMPETLAFSVRFKASYMTMYYYTSKAK